MPLMSRLLCLVNKDNGLMSKAILSTNLSKLMAAHLTLTTQAKVAKEAKVDQKTISRIILKTHSCGVENLEAIAAAFELQSWQLLVPGLDPKSPPVCEFTQVERDLYKKLRKLVKLLPND